MSVQIVVNEITHRAVSRGCAGDMRGQYHVLYRHQLSLNLWLAVEYVEGCASDPFVAQSPNQGRVAEHKITKLDQRLPRR